MVIFVCACSVCLGVYVVGVYVGDGDCDVPAHVLLSEVIIFYMYHF